jgi:hypothetical protein
VPERVGGSGTDVTKCRLFQPRDSRGVQQLSEAAFYIGWTEIVTVNQTDAFLVRREMGYDLEQLTVKVRTWV